MMGDEQQQSEDNVARLMRVAYCTEFRPSREASRRARRCLAAQLRPPRRVAAFPEGVLGLLAGSLLLIAAWLAVQPALPGYSASAAVPGVVLACVLFINLALVPVAGIIIVIGRRYA